ncbi:hypothetical protein C8R43DRAFT_1131159 [Mycena crocata]|nr:hypothetical protein C8R43DRAFT_1131159 [Mycena crocata]
MAALGGAVPLGLHSAPSLYRLMDGGLVTRTTLIFPSLPLLHWFLDGGLGRYVPHGLHFAFFFALALDGGARIRERIHKDYEDLCLICVAFWCAAARRDSVDKGKVWICGGYLAARSLRLGHPHP